jgi:hypothetical protein
VADLEETFAMRTSNPDSESGSEDDRPIAAPKKVCPPAFHFICLLTVQKVASTPSTPTVADLEETFAMRTSNPDSESDRENNRPIAAPKKVCPPAFHFICLLTVQKVAKAAIVIDTDDRLSQIQSKIHELEGVIAEMAEVRANSSGEDEVMAEVQADDSRPTIGKSFVFFFF